MKTRASGSLAVAAAVTGAVLLWAALPAPGRPSRGERLPGAEAAEPTPPGAADSAPEAVGDLHAHHGPGGAMPPEAPSAGSLYVLDHDWTDQAGRVLELGTLAGRPRVVAMIYTSCTYTCPRVLARMKWIEAQTGDADPERAPGLVLVSIDPERDTPERLRAFADGAALDPARWTLLTGSPDAVRELSVLLGVRYRSAPDGTLSHSNALVVLDAGGRPAGRVDGLDADLAPVLDALREAAAR